MQSSAIKTVAIIGGGPAGLMAADALCSKGIAVDIYDAMPSLGRKFLMAGKSGLNLTHAEPFTAFMTRFADAEAPMTPILEALSPNAIQTWAHGLGIETFVGSSGRVFPLEFKAAPLLRAWLRRLRAAGVRIHVRHKWTGWAADGTLTFQTPAGEVLAKTDATILALGGASWPQLGSDGAWVTPLQSKGVTVAPLQPANCGFDVAWSAHMREKHQGEPLKGIKISIDGHTAGGECMITEDGLEGGPIYALSGVIRNAITKHGSATIQIDFAPDLNASTLATRLAKPRGKKSMATHLRRTVSMSGAKAALLREGVDLADYTAPDKLAARIKALPITLLRPRPIVEAISSAGGIIWADLTDELELKHMSGVFVAGEMLDWDAPTGGYLLSGCMATGKWVGDAVARRLGRNLDAAVGKNNAHDPACSGVS